MDVRAVIALVAGTFLEELAGENFVRFSSALVLLPLTALVGVVAIVTRSLRPTVGLLIVLLIVLIRLRRLE